MRVAILHNEVSQQASAADRDVLIQVEAVAAALVRLGHAPSAVPVTLDLASLARRLDASRPEVAFNLVESLGGSDRLMFLPTALLDVLQIPYTGSPTEAILATGDKPAAKSRLARAGLPTPEWLADCNTPIHHPACSNPIHRVSSESPNDLDPMNAVTTSGEERIQHSACSNPIHRVSLKSPSDLDRMNAVATSGGRYIIKPVWEHASLGMDGESVVGVADGPELALKLADRQRQAGRRLFAERFVDGREFNLSLLASPDGPQVLPPAEIDFSAFSEEEPKIVGYDAKWNEDSPAYHNTPRRFEFAPADRPLLDELAALAEECWDLFGLRGYARVDFRVDAAGRPWILEINANPCLSPDAGFAAAVDQASLAFEEAIARIVDDALSPRPTAGS